MKHFILILACLLTPPAFAHEGHDHGEAPTPPPAADAAPRFEAASETFELVGVLRERVLTLYLDHYASNAPVEKARLELETGKRKWQARESEPGVYRVELGDAPVAGKPGRHGLVFTVEAGDAVDLLTAHLEITAPKSPPVVADAFDGRQLGWAGLALPLLGWWAWRRSGRKGHD